MKKSFDHFFLIKLCVCILEGVDKEPRGYKAPLFVSIELRKCTLSYTQYQNIRNGGVFPVLGWFLIFPIFSLLRFLSLTRMFLKFFKIFTLVS